MGAVQAANADSSLPDADGRIACPSCRQRNAPDRMICECCAAPLPPPTSPPETDPAPKPPFATLLLRRAVIFALVTAFVFNVLLALVGAVPGPVPPARAVTGPVVAAPTPAPARSGDVNIDLGTQPAGFGSQDQAKELLALIERQPGMAAYSISYRTDEGSVAFGCDLTRDVLVRVHHLAANRGTSEAWTGYALERLAAGAAGRSLDDTPAGQIPAASRRF
jgi:hypothetical protein